MIFMDCNEESNFILKENSQRENPCIFICVEIESPVGWKNVPHPDVIIRRFLS